jgi:Family of unknown function (DUF5752)
MLRSASRYRKHHNCAAVRSIFWIFRFGSRCCDIYAISKRNGSNTAETPFEFFTVSYLTRIGNHSAGTLTELLTALQNCSDASIFHHTFQTLGRHHFLTKGFSNDFSHWLADGLGLGTLADSVNHIDIYPNTLDSARAKVLRLIDREQRKG